MVDELKGHMDLLETPEEGSQQMGQAEPQPAVRSGVSGGLNQRLRRIRWRGRRVEWAAYGFLAPFGLFFGVFTLAGIVFGLYLSFTEWGIMGSPEWVGLENYARALDDSWVPLVWLNTVKYTLMVVPVSTVLGLLLAVFVNQRLPGYVAARVCFYAPRVVAVTVVSLVWVWLLDTRFGLVNIFLSTFGIPKIPWLTTQRWVLFGVGLTSVWWISGYNMVILLAGLQGIPEELRESATIDGATAPQVFWHIVLPLLRPSLSLVVTLGLIMGFRVFGQVYVMTAGGPAGASSTVIWYIFDQGFREYRLGYAAALSILLFLTIFAVTLIQQRFLRERAT